MNRPRSLPASGLHAIPSFRVDESRAITRPMLPGRTRLPPPLPPPSLPRHAPRRPFPVEESGSLTLAMPLHRPPTHGGWVRSVRLSRLSQLTPILYGLVAGLLIGGAVWLGVSGIGRDEAAQERQLATGGPSVVPAVARPRFPAAVDVDAPPLINGADLPIVPPESRTTVVNDAPPVSRKSR